MDTESKRGEQRNDGPGEIHDLSSGMVKTLAAGRNGPSLTFLRRRGSRRINRYHPEILHVLRRREQYLHSGTSVLVMSLSAHLPLVRFHPPFDHAGVHGQ